MAGSFLVNAFTILRIVKTPCVLTARGHSEIQTQTLWCLESGQLLKVLMPVSLFAPAKLNLGLSIVGRRVDGFHLLESLFWPLTFGDNLYLSEGSSEIAMKWSGTAPFHQTLPKPDANLVSKVLQALISENYLEKLPKIEIEKNIPIGGGLGGGSSNAGTVIHYLREQMQFLKFPSYDWFSRFGADIPFFIEKKPSWVSGVGEKISPLELADELIERLHFLLVLLPFGCETQTIFREYRNSGIPFSTSIEPFPEGKVTGANLLSYLSTADNDLEGPVRLLHPLIGTVLDKLRSTPAFFSSLSGSGSTCFAVYDSAVDRENSIKDLSPFFRVNGCKGITAETFAVR